jgi:hypothetical protein
VSFDTGVFDPQVFGANMDSCLFDPEVFDSAVFDVCVEAEPEPEPAGTPSGGRVRKVRYACEIDGRWLSFDSMEDLEAYLEALQEEKLEKVQERAEKAVQRILRAGKAKTPPPLIRVAKAPVEVREYIDELNQKIELIYRLKIQEELMARADEEDVELLAVL